MTTIHGFELLREQYIPELNTTARLFRHAKTGAQLLSMENNDENKVFGISFFTPPPDSTGVAHIMEHSVLCGSRKYPVKEPFVELMKGSLNTFLNAFTFSDKTCYPIASQNLRDFYNLIDVYLDAVFYPLIPEHTLQQEGWHYELEDKGAPLVYKGVVFNEMKGVYSSPDQMLGRYTQESLLPDTIYGVDSGGDPNKIPDLTYKEFKEFHDIYYHPSNALIYFYGDDDPDERLRYLDTWLSEFEPISIDHTIKPQPRFAEPVRLIYPYDAGAESDGTNKNMVAVNWLLSETDAPETLLARDILSYILVGSPASPLRKALIDSGLGEDLTSSGVESEIKPGYFTVGLRGVASEDTDKVEPLVVETLGTLAEHGIDQDMIDAAMNTIEFQLRENNTGNFPRGLALMLRSLTTWLYGDDPLVPLAFEAPLTAIKQHVAADEHYFEDMIRNNVLDNKHQTTVVLIPDSEYRTRADVAEKARLEEVRASLSDDELLAIIENTHELKRLQTTPDSPEALAKIPSLKLEDLDRKNKNIPIVVSQDQGSTLLYHDLFTNGVVYLDVGLNLHMLPLDLLPYVPLFSRALLEIGTETEDYVKLSQRIGRKTGGITTRPFTSMTEGAQEGIAWLFLRGKSTPAQADDLLAILSDVLLTVKLDNQERFRQMALEEKAGEEAQVVPRGHISAYKRLKSAFNEADWADEHMSGVSYLQFLGNLVEAIDTDWPSVLAKLETIRHTLLNRNTIIVNVTLDAANWSKFQPKLSSFLASLPAALPELAQWSPVYDFAFEGLTIPAQVNYVAKGANLYTLGYQESGSASVVNNFLQTTWMWERVRVQGGAYGGFTVFDNLSGVFSYLSYRDPNLLSTLENYDAAAQYLRQVNLNSEELTRSIIGAIGDLDAYQLPDAKGFTSMVRYLTGRTDEIRQQRRDEILSTTVHDFHTFGEALQGVTREGRIVVVGSQEAIDSANAARNNFLRVTKAV